MGRSEIATDAELTVATTANTGNRWALIISRAWDMDERFDFHHSHLTSGRESAEQKNLAGLETPARMASAMGPKDATDRE